MATQQKAQGHLLGMNQPLQWPGGGLPSSNSKNTGYEKTRNTDSPSYFDDIKPSDIEQVDSFAMKEAQYRESVYSYIEQFNSYKSDIEKAFTYSGRSKDVFIFQFGDKISEMKIALEKSRFELDRMKNDIETDKKTHDDSKFDELAPNTILADPFGDVYDRKSYLLSNAGYFFNAGEYYKDQMMKENGIDPSTITNKQDVYSSIDSFKKYFTENSDSGAFVYPYHKMLIEDIKPYGSEYTAYNHPDIPGYYDTFYDHVKEYGETIVGDDGSSRLIRLNTDGVINGVDSWYGDRLQNDSELGRASRYMVSLEEASFKNNLSNKFLPASAQKEFQTRISDIITLQQSLGVKVDGTPWVDDPLINIVQNPGLYVDALTKAVGQGIIDVDQANHYNAILGDPSSNAMALRWQDINNPDPTAVKNIPEDISYNLAIHQRMANEKQMLSDKYIGSGRTGKTSLTEKFNHLSQVELGKISGMSELPLLQTTVKKNLYQVLTSNKGLTPEEAAKEADWVPGSTQWRSGILNYIDERRDPLTGDFQGYDNGNFFFDEGSENRIDPYIVSRNNYGDVQGFFKDTVKLDSAGGLLGMFGNHTMSINGEEWQIRNVWVTGFKGDQRMMVPVGPDDFIKDHLKNNLDVGTYQGMTNAYITGVEFHTYAKGYDYNLSMSDLIKTQEYQDYMTKNNIQLDAEEFINLNSALIDPHSTDPYNEYLQYLDQDYKVRMQGHIMSEDMQAYVRYDPEIGNRVTFGHFLDPSSGEMLPLPGGHIVRSHGKWIVGIDPNAWEFDKKGVPVGLKPDKYGVHAETFFFMTEDQLKQIKYPDGTTGYDKYGDDKYNLKEDGTRMLYSDMLSKAQMRMTQDEWNKIEAYLKEKNDLYIVGLLMGWDYNKNNRYWNILGSNFSKDYKFDPVSEHGSAADMWLDKTQLHFLAQ